MFGFSLGEMLFLAILALVVIGPKQLPEVARNVAKFLNELKRTTATFTDEIKRQASIDLETPPQPGAPQPVVPPPDLAQPSPAQAHTTGETHTPAPPQTADDPIHPSGDKRES